MCSVDHDSVRRRLAQAASIADPFRRRMYVLGIVTSALVADGVVPPILVGGGAVDFYTLGGYATQDIDVVIAAHDKLDAVLKDRLRGYTHWQSVSDGERVGRSIALHEASKDWEYLNCQAEKEGLLEALESVNRACGSS